MSLPFGCDTKAHTLMNFGACVLFASACFLLAACEEEPGAVPPSSVRDVATFVAGADDAAADSDGETGIREIGDFHFSRDTLPAADRVYFIYGDDLWEIEGDGDTGIVAEDLTIVSYSASATGDRLAILFLERDESGRDQPEITILEPDGEVMVSLSEFDGEFDLSKMSPIQSIAMNPAGESLALTHQNGAVTLVTLEGEIKQLLQPSIEHQPGRLAWSMDGQFIAYLDPWMPDETSSLFVMVPGRDIQHALVHATSDGEGVVRARWIPGSSYIAVIRSSGSTISHGGDLFLVDVETGNQELLMSSGEIAPVAGLVDIAPSPDGEWLAATAFVPGDVYPRFAGLWMIDLQRGMNSEIETVRNGVVTDLWWLGDDLLVRTVDEPRTSLPGTYTGREEFRLLEIDPVSGRVSERYPDEGADHD
jgi:hypothetical protein